MPIYEYRCGQGHTFEVMQRMTDDPVSSCQTCSSPVQRVFHPVAVHFKGSGFYNTDYGTRKRSREQSESADGKPDSKAKAKDNGAAPAKSDAAAPKKAEASTSSSASD